MIITKLHDPEEEIRLQTLTKLLEFAQTNITSLSTETYDAICDRVKDKKNEVRKVTLLGLSKLYYRHVSSRLPPISEIDGKSYNDLTSTISEETFDRLESVPSIILKSWGYPEFSSKHLILQLLQEYIIPKSIKADNNTGNGSHHADDHEEEESDNDRLNEVRASALLLLFRSMKEDVDKISFGAIVNFKVKVAEELNHFLRLKSAKSGNGERLSLGSTPVDETARLSEIRQSLNNVAYLIPMSEKKHTAFDRLITSK